MNTISISAKAEVLREEIKLILNQERLYRKARQRSLSDRMAHAARELRLMAIREELAKLQSGPSVRLDAVKNSASATRC